MPSFRDVYGNQAPEPPGNGPSGGPFGDVGRMLGGWYHSQSHIPTPGVPGVPLSPSVPIIGQGAPIELSRSFDAMITGFSAAMREATAAAERIALRTEQAAMALGDAAEGARIAAVASKDTAQVQRDAMAAVADMVPEDAQTPPAGTLQPPETQPSPTPAQPATEPTVAPAGTPTAVPETAVPEALTATAILGSYGYEKGRFSAAGLRRAMVTRAAQRISEMQPKTRLEQDSTGTWRHWDPRILDLPEDEQDLALQAMPQADEAEVTGYLRSAATLGIAKNVFGGWAEGKPVGQAILGALPTGAAKVAGIAGAVLTAGNYLSDFAESQRATNAAYQRVLGGTNVEGFAERARANLFGLSQFGVMKEEEAERLYQQTLSIYGTDRESAGAANQFATDAYRQFGMTVDQSTQLIRRAAGEGTEAFSRLTDALRNVTTAARDAGISAERAREMFTSNYQAAARVASGAGGIAIAQQMTGAQIDLGRRFENVDLTAQTSEMQLRMQAAQLGMSLADYQASFATPEGQMQRAQAVDANVGKLVANQLGPEATGYIAQRLAELDPEGRGANLDENDPTWTALAAEVQSRYDIDPAIMASVLGSLGGVQGLDLSNSMEYAVRTSVGQTSQVAAAQEEIKRVSQRQVDTGALRSVSGPRGLITANTPEMTDLLSSVGLAEDDSLAKQTNIFGVNKTNVANMRRQYVRGVKESGVRNPVVEQLLGEVSEETRLQVRTADGERVVSVEEGLAHFQDQIQSGEAMIVAGAGEGKTVGDFLGSADQSAKVTSDKDKKLAGVGQTVEEFRKDQGGKGGGRVLIAPTPELARWLNFTTSGSAYIDPARRAGVQPTASPAPELMTGG